MNEIIHICSEGWLQRTPEGNYVSRLCVHQTVLSMHRGRLKEHRVNACGADLPERPAVLGASR